MIKQRFKNAAAPLDEEYGDAMRNLVQRLSHALPDGRAPRVVAFMAARVGEGTTTIASEYASVLAAQAGGRVLLIVPGTIKEMPPRDIQSPEGIVEAIAMGRPVTEAVLKIEHGVSIARWVGDGRNHGRGVQVAQDESFWKSLLAAFGSVVIDAPALQLSYDGILLAAKADCAVLVVEAEKTPQPVVRNLQDTLLSAGATIAGVVMNKRNRHIPEKIYSKL